MLVKASVFSRVRRFEESGRNRWGEFIFACEARRRGARIAVLDHFLYHVGEGTKGNQDKSLSSISYQVERKIWEAIVRRYVRQEDVRIERREVLAGNFRKRLVDRQLRVLLVGIGTATEFILAETRPDRARVAFCSGLPEEVDTDFYGRRVLAISDVPFWGFDWVVVTPLTAGEKLYRELILPRLPPDFSGRVSVVEVDLSGDQLVYRFRDVGGATAWTGQPHGASHQAIVPD
jgi:hypothetical protein